jgi:hypothetical protein
MLVPSLLLLLPAFVIAGALAAFAGLVRGLARLIEPRYSPWSQLTVFDRNLGWRPRPNLDTHYLAELDDVFRVATDAEGWPGRRSLDECPVVVIGDSFAFGYGTNPSRSFSELAGGVAVKAVGAPGYSMVHGVLLMEEFAERLAGKLVVWFVYLENDLQDNLAPEMRQYRAPFVRRHPLSGEWAIVHSHVRPDRWRLSNLDHRRLFTQFCIDGPLADRAYSACDYLIGRAAAACTSRSARLVVVTIPHPMQLVEHPGAFDPGFPDRRVAECCRRHGVPMVAARDGLTRRDYKRREGIHWSARGHRRMAALVRTLYEADRSHRAGRIAPDHAPTPLEWNLWKENTDAS